MIKRIIGRRGLVLGVLASACTTAPVRNSIDAAAEAELMRRPMDYVNGEARAFAVARQGRLAGLLWGTVHFGYSDTTVMPAPIRRIFEQSSSLSVEEVFDRLPISRVRAIRAVFNRGLTTPSPAALAGLPPATRQALDASGVSVARLEKLSLAGMAAAVGQQADAIPAGPLDPGPIVDVNLVRFARGAEIPVFGLEQPAPAAIKDMWFRDDPNGPKAAAALDQALRRRAAGGSLREWLQQQYGEGATGRLVAGLTGWEATKADLARSDARRAAVLTARNLAWIDPIEARLQNDGKPAFIAFGCGHLLGTDGVVALLRGKGWEVTPCLGDRCAPGRPA